MANMQQGAPGLSASRLDARSHNQISLSRRILAMTIVPVLLLYAVTIASAQSIRGTVLDAANREPLEDASVVLLTVRGNDTVVKATRTNILGQFAMYAPDKGDYRVSVVRLGYAPLTGSPMAMKDAEVALVEMVMSAVPSTIGSFEVISRHALASDELMSTVGFDTRRARKVGQFISREDLARYGQSSLENAIRDNAVRLGLAFAEDRSMNEIVVMRSGMDYCLPEVRLDGNLVTNVRGFLVSRLRTYGAHQIHGVEVYRERQVPPPRLSSDLGTSAPGCGAIAIWTRALATQTSQSLFTNFIR